MMTTPYFVIKNSDDYIPLFVTKISDDYTPFLLLNMVMIYDYVIDAWTARYSLLYFPLAWIVQMHAYYMCITFYPMFGRTLF